MSADLYKRLDAARSRRYPESSTREFTMWLLDIALNTYEDSERRAAAAQRLVVSPDELERTRIFDVAPGHSILVRE